MPNFQVGISVDKTELEDGFSSSAASGQTWAERLNIVFGDAAGSSKRAFASISDDAKTMAENVTPEQLKVAEASRELAKAKADERQANILAKAGSMEAAEANALLAASISRVADATRNLKEAQAAAAPKTTGGTAGADAVVSEFAGSGDSSEASKAVAAATIADTAAKAELKEVTEALAASTADEATQQEALAAAQDKVRATSAALAEAQAALKAEADAARLALQQQEQAALATARAGEAAAAGLSSEKATRAAAAILENASAQKALRETTELASNSVLSEQEKLALLAPVAERARIATIELAEANEALATSSHHSVTDVQATSAAIRSLEGNGGIRAVENFTAKVLGLGPLMQAIFPIVGGLMFAKILFDMGEKLYDLEQKGAHAATEIARAFGEMTEKLSAADDELALSNSRLEDQIAKLSGHPTDGLVTALAEGTVAADKLQEALAGDVKQLQALLKEHNVSAFEGALAGVAGTATSNKVITDAGKALEIQGERAQTLRLKDLQDAKTVYQQHLDAAGSNAAARQAASETFHNAQIAADNRYYATQKSNAESFAREMRKHATDVATRQTQLDNNAAMMKSGYGISITPVDLTPERTEYEKAAETGDRIADHAGLSQTNFADEQQKGKLEGQKQSREAQAHEDELARKAAEKRFQAMEAELNEWKTMAPVSAKAEREFWDERIDAFQVGSQQYDAITRKQAELSDAAARRLHEGFQKLAETQKKGTEDESKVDTKVAEGLTKWTKQLDEDLTRSGERWESYWKDVARGQEISAQVNVEIAEASLRALEASGGITALGAAQREAQIHAEQHRLTLQALREELERLEKGATKNPVTGQVEDPKQAAQIAQVKNQISQETGKGQAQGISDQSVIQQQVAAPWKTAFQTINSDFSSMTASILRGQESMAQGFRKMGESMVVSTIQNLEQITLKWMEHEVMTLAAHNAGNAAKVASDTTAAATSSSVSHSTALKEIFGDAKSAAAATWKATAAIPIIGPGLAPIAAAGAFAGVMALASFDVGTAYVPHDGVAMIHKGESILPPPQTQALMDGLGNGGKAKSTTINNNFGGNTFHGSGGEDFPSMLDTHEDALAYKVSSLMRDRHPAFQN